MNCDYTDPGGTPLERLTQQQAGNHPAPCARSCEANAYEIEVRRYQAEVEQFRADARRFRLAEKNLFDVQEAAKIIAKQAIAAEAERDALAAKLKDAEHDRDEFRRVMNGFAEKMAELEGQYPVFAFRRRGQTDFCTCTEGRYNELAEKPHLFEVRKLYARPVPAEPVNARLLTALKACRNKLAHDAEMVAMADVAIMGAEAALVEPQPDADGWIPWAGGECPVDPDALVRVRYADFLEEEGRRAGQYTWRHSNPHDPSDIIAYRVVRP